MQVPASRHYADSAMQIEAAKLVGQALAEPSAPRWAGPTGEKVLACAFASLEERAVLTNRVWDRKPATRTGIGEVGNPMGAHALGVLELLGFDLSCPGRRDLCSQANRKFLAGPFASLERRRVGVEAVAEVAIAGLGGD